MREYLSFEGAVRLVSNDSARYRVYCEIVHGEFAGQTVNLATVQACDRWRDVAGRIWVSTITVNDLVKDGV